MRRVLMGLAALAVTIYVGLVLLLYVEQRSLVFPSRTRVSPAAEAGLDGFKDVVLATPDGERLVGWWKPPQPGKALVVYLHGNGTALYDRRDRARRLTADGRGLLMMAYRGYSGSTGSPSEEGLATDAATIHAWVTKGYQTERIVLYGESLGTGVAVRLASERRVGGVILDAPFTSAEDVAALRYPFVPVRWLMKDPFRSKERIASIRAPLLVLHGEADEVIPFGFGQALFAAAAEPKRFVALPGVRHSGVLEQGGWPEIDAFLARVEAAIPATTDAPAPGSSSP